MCVRDLVAAIDLGQNIGLCIAELGERAPFRTTRLECYSWARPANYKSLAKTPKLAAWTSAATEHLMQSVGWLTTEPGIVAVVFERRFIHPTGKAHRTDPRTTEGIQEQADWLHQTFGARAQKVDPNQVSRETGIAKSAERWRLTLDLLPPADAPKPTGRVIDARTAWHPVLARFDEAQGGSVTKHVLSAMKLAFWYARADAFRRRVEEAT